MSDESAVEERPTGSRKRIVTGGAILLLVAVVAAGIWFSGILNHRGGQGPAHATIASTEKPVLFDLPDIVSNLDTGGHRAAFIKMHAKLEVGHAAELVALQAAMPQILDIFQSYLRSTRPEELRGGEGTYRLREALMNRLDALLAPTQVTDLLFTEVLVQ